MNTNNKNKIIENNEFKIYQDTKKESYFIIEFNEPSKSLINSLIKTKILLGASSSDDYTSIFFTSYTIETLEQFKNKNKKINNTTRMTYNNALQMTETLSKQLNYLIINEYKSFYAYNTENIIVINESIFIYLSNDDLLFINSDTQKIEITFPFSKKSKTLFISPELSEINTLPCNIHYKTIYYSLSSLIINLLQDEKTIYNTKLYFLLMRCLDEEIENRSILFI